jgi:competence protein ComEC
MQLTAGWTGIGRAALGLAAWWRFPLAAWMARWVQAERGRFALWLPVFMGAGVILFFSLLSDPPWWAALAAASGAAALLALCWWALPGVPVPRALLAMALAGAAGFGSAQLATARAPPPVDLPTHGVTITGTVRAVEVLPAGQRVVLEAPSLDGEPALPRRLRIRLRANDGLDVATGDTVRVRAMVRPPAPPAYPGGWDLQRDAFFAGMGGYGYALTRAERIDRAPPGEIVRRVQWLRETIGGRVAAALPGEEGPIAATLLAGITSAIPAADRAAFRDSGLAHLLAIAGLHIGIVMGLFLGLSRLVLALWEHAALHWPCKQIAVLIALASGGVYMVMTGAHVPIIRSFSMACLMALGVLSGRRALSLRGLAVAATVLMTISPSEVLGVSFQMSFSAVLALIAGYDALRPVLARLRGGGGGAVRRFGMHVVALALTSALAGTASAPYGAYHFGRIQLYYVVANMLAVPLTAMWVMPAGLIALALMPVHLEFLALVPMGWGIDAILWVGRSVSSWPAATLAVPHMPAWGLAATSLGIAWLGLWRTRLRLGGLAGIALGIASPAFDHPPDILVSADARLIALRDGAAMRVEARSGASAFTRDAWQQYWAAATVAPMPAAGAAEGGAVCGPTFCTLRPRAEGVAALLLRGAPPRAACDAAVLVSAEPIRLRCGFWLPWVDRFSVWRDGAQAIWLGPEEARIVSDREVRGDRPWVPPSPSPRGGR